MFENIHVVAIPVFVFLIMADIACSIANAVFSRASRFIASVAGSFVAIYALNIIMTKPSVFAESPTFYLALLGISAGLFASSPKNE